MKIIKMTEHFITTPNLPENRVKAVFLGEKYDKLSSTLNEMGIVTILLRANCAISPNIHCHTDMSVFHMGQNRIVLSRHIDGIAQIDDRLRKMGFDIIITDRPNGSDYPEDIALNACLLGDMLFHKKGCTDANILAAAHEFGWKSIYVNQGYAKCSICVLDKKHIITSDTVIHKKALDAGVESLLISPGQINLEGYNTGFIGGACGKISKHEIAFTGILKHHIDEKRILEFIKSAGLEPVFLTQEPIYDVGSIIPIIEA